MSQTAVTEKKTANWKEYIKNYYEEHREERLQAMKDYKKQNKVKISEYNQLYYRANKDKYKTTKRCEVCDCVMSSLSFNRHVKSKRHQKNIPNCE